MKNFKALSALLGAVALGGALTMGSVAQANTLDINGINWMVGTNGTNGVQLVSGGYDAKFLEQLTGGTPSTPNGNGYGYIDGLGLSGTTSNYCASGSSCLLTFTFGNFKPGSTDAYLNVYVNDKSHFNTDLSSGGSTAADATTSTPFLTLSAYNVQTTTFNTTQGQYAFSADFNPTSTLMGGATSVGAANWTLTEDPGFFMNMSASLPNGVAPTGYMGGTANGDYHAVPEPNDLGMMGLGLLMVGLLGLRFRQAKFRRDQA